ncbi:MAG TPA: glycosyltransferase family 1 protein [Xanthobacteraceae bacterium]
MFRNVSAEGDESSAQDRGGVVWFEVEDFLRYFDHFRNPTGLQRVPFEIFVEAERHYGRLGRVRFCRLSVYTKQLIPIDFAGILQAYLHPPGAGAPWKTIWAPARFFSEPFTMLPVIARHPGFFLRLFKTAARDGIDLILRRRRFEAAVRPGDILVSLGASWGVPHYMKHIAQAKRRHGIRYAFLIHDLIPIENPTFVEERHVAQFRDWLAAALPNADVVLTVSQYSRDTLRALAGAAGWRLPRVAALRPGTALSDRPVAGGGAAMRFPERFVLLVSTIEIRKNHRLLVEVWRRLLERHGAEAVPVLIFVGQIGWLVDDLLAGLAASRYLSGKIEHRRGLSDADLRAAYRSCLFTIFPSLCEGWGLPVAESLAQGKFCVASNRTSIPEVGGDLVDYFDPTNEDDALAKIERLLFEPDYLAAREARVRAQFRPRSWADCVHALVDALDPSAPAASGAR